MSGIGTGGRTGRVGVGVIGAGVISAQYLGNLTVFPDLDSSQAPYSSLRGDASETFAFAEAARS